MCRYTALSRISSHLLSAAAVGLRHRHFVTDAWTSHTSVVTRQERHSRRPASDDQRLGPGPEHLNADRGRSWRQTRRCAARAGGPLVKTAPMIGPPCEYPAFLTRTGWSAADADALHLSSPSTARRRARWARPVSRESSRRLWNDAWGNAAAALTTDLCGWFQVRGFFDGYASPALLLPLPRACGVPPFWLSPKRISVVPSTVLS